MATKEVDLGMVRGDINDSVATFAQASSRSNINSGETGKTIFGKIKKWFADMGSAAFCAVVNNATTTATNTVLDGRMGKTLGDRIDELNRNIQSAITKVDSFATSPNVASLNDINQNGFYAFGTNTTGAPYPTLTGICMHVQRGSDALQVVWGLGGENLNNVYKRRKISGGWATYITYKPDA